MGFLGETFVIGDDVKSDFEPIPEGWYSANITKSELKDTKAGTGKYVSVQFCITGPSYQGRVVFCNLNVRNQSEQAENIGRQQLMQLGLACGLKAVSDTDQFVGCSLEIKVKISGDRNEVKGFKSNESSIPNNKTTIGVAKPAAGNVPAGSPPWAKKG